MNNFSVYDSRNDAGQDRGIRYRERGPGETKGRRLRGAPRLEVPSCVPDFGKRPKVLDDLLASSNGPHRLGMVLNGPERFGEVIDTHQDPAVFRAVIGPGQLYKFRTIGYVDVKGMVPNGLDGTDAFEQIFVGVVDGGDKSVFHDRQPFQLGPKLDAKALKTETNAKYRGKQIVRELPEMFDYSDVPQIFG